MVNGLSAPAVKTVLSPGPYRDRVLAEIRAEMARQRVTQDSLAGKLRWHQVTLSRRLRGVTHITVEEVQAIAGALQVPAEQLLADESV